MNALIRTGRGLAAVILVVFAVSLAPAGAGAKAVPALDARLGGTSASFQTAFGVPNKTKSGNGIEVYDVQGFGLVAAAFLNSNANEITIAANRLAHTPLTEPDAADWTVTNGTTFADALLPSDATYGSPKKTTADITLTGHSPSLEGAFTKANFTSLKVGGVPGDFTVIYNLDTSGNVYSIDMSAGAGAAAAAPTVKASSTAKASATKASSSNSAPSGAAVHCSSFQTQAEAQAYFDSHGGTSNPTVSGLDGDKDGKACETLP